MLSLASWSGRTQIPHGVLAGAEDRDAGDPLDAGHLVVDVDVGVVGQKDVVVGVVGRRESEHEVRRRGRFRHRNTVVVDIGRQLR